jgi:hypothetical protein
MNQYRRSSRWPLKSVVCGLMLLTLAFFALFYQIHNLKIKVDTQPFELQPQIVAPVINPCLELQQANEQSKKQIVGLRQRQSALLSELSLEVELVTTKGGKVSSSRIAELLRKYDNTESRIYSKLYPIGK